MQNSLILPFRTKNTHSKNRTNHELLKKSATVFEEKERYEKVQFAILNKKTSNALHFWFLPQNY